MELKPVETGPENKWPLNAEGVISSKLIGQALLMKGLIQRDMPITSIDDANRICDAMIATAKQVEALEHAPLIGGFSED